MFIASDAAPADNAITCTFSGQHAQVHDTTPAYSLSLVSADSNLHIPAPWLAGARTEQIFADFTPIGTTGAFDLYECTNMLIGCARISTTDATLANDTRALYRDLLGITRDHHLYRIWNYVPHINRWTDNKENYREFCRGRSLAFEDLYHANASQRMPAASAVGCESDALCIMFVAGCSMSRHIENPQQTPAYLYPQQYGPRSPSFSRATAVNENGNAHIFISGTASIKGHTTIAVGNLEGQIACTIDNLRLISQAAGAGAKLGLDTPDAHDWRRHFKVYLRHAIDLQHAQSLLAPADNTGLIRSTDRVVWLRSDICRSDLDIEIEATLVRSLLP